MQYQRCGRSGVLLPKVSLGLWHNFGDTHPLETQRAVLRRAFDLGVTHIDLANNYGPPPGCAETNFGTLFAQDFRPYRDELFIARRPDIDMWPGPYGEWGSRKYVLASLDQSLTRMGLDYVDVFYSHRFDPDTPLEETMGALTAPYGRARPSTPGCPTTRRRPSREAAAILKELRTPLPDQPASVLDAPARGRGRGAGGVGRRPVPASSPSRRSPRASSPTAIWTVCPADSRMALGHFLKRDALTEERLTLLHALNKLAGERGQTLAQLALAWVLRDPRVVSVLIGASSVAQLEQNLAVLDSPGFSDAELAEIDRLSAEAGVRIP